MSKILRIDMSRLRVTEELVPDSYRLLGGRALTSRIISEEVDARAHPLSEDAKLVFAPGLLGGTAITTSGRTSFGAESPLMKGRKGSNVGGRRVDCGERSGGTADASCRAGRSRRADGREGAEGDRRRRRQREERRCGGQGRVPASDATFLQGRARRSADAQPEPLRNRGRDQ